MEFSVTIPFEESRVAEIIFNALRVDPEPNRARITKNLRLEGTNLIAEFKSQEPKVLRVSVGSFFDLLSLTVQTVDQFNTFE